jgi:TusA-related sulfurtransferase
MVIADDPAIEFDLPAWARAAGHRVEEVSREGREFRYRVHPGKEPS